ncbi:MAG: DUF2059 domain-containing protein [Hyphomicrobiales bacterium]
MFRLFALLMVLLGFAATSSANAQDAGSGAETPKKPEISQRHLNIAFETVFITRTTRAYGEVLPNLARRVKARLTERSPKLKDPIEKAVDDVALALVERQGELDLLIARSWAERFSVQELRDISAFFATPTGTKLAKANTELISAGLDIARQWGQQMGVEMVRAVTEKLKKQGHQL